MVNWNDPAVLARDEFAFMNLNHLLYGIYIWEFVTTLHFEWDHIRGRREYRWTIWLYSSTRLAALGSIITGLVGYNVTTPYDCQVWLIWAYFLAYLALWTSLMLMSLRVIAIWDGNKIAMAITCAAWLTNFAFDFRSLIVSKAIWNPAGKGCDFINSDDGRYNFTATLSAEVTLLVTMLVGLLRQRDHALGRLLFNQNLFWLALATVTDVPPVTFLWLNLNEIWNEMFCAYTLISITICATRMYRSLVSFKESGDRVTACLERDLGEDPGSFRAHNRSSSPLQFSTAMSGETRTVEFGDLVEKGLEGGWGEVSVSPRKESFGFGGGELGVVREDEVGEFEGRHH